MFSAFSNYLPNSSLVHWLRPEAFWLLLLLIPLWWFIRRAGASEGRWSKIVDQHLLPYLLVGQPSRSEGWSPFGWFLGWIILVVALAGPAWQQVATPVFKKDQALVIVLDLSPLMLAEDVKPSRIARAKYKLIDLLQARKEGQTALVVFADEPYVVAPLTQDSNTLINFLPALTPELMPSAGQRLDEALSQAEKLITQAGTARGEIVLITGGLADNSAAENKLREMHARGIISTIYVVGTTTGSPIPRPQGGFLKDNQGNILMAHMDVPRLRQLAQAGGGRLIMMTHNNDDITELTRAFEPALPFTQKNNARDVNLTVWRDEGHWVVLLLLPLFLLLFRRGVRL
jgi:Ca-activated chloride channel family protein